MNIPHKTQKKEKIKKTAGFAMLFAVLVSSLLIAIGISIFNISLKELMISTSERDSQMAWYAGDSAIECALYWSNKFQSFPFCNNASCSSKLGSTTNTIICNGIPVPLNFVLIGTAKLSYSTTTFFKFSPTSNLFPESGITITTTGPIPNFTRSITARGHNIGVIGRRVERGLVRGNN